MFIRRFGTPRPGRRAVRRRGAVPRVRSTDDPLVAEGMPPVDGGDGGVLVIACGALAREILAIRAQAGLDHVALQCLPAILHNHPDRIVPAVEAAVAAARGRYARVFVAYADCGTGGGLRRLCDRLGVEMVEGPHCYAFFEGPAAFAARDEVDAFYLTDFLARQFDAFVTRPLGLDRHPELRDAYFGHYARLVYLAQTDDPALDAKARAAAAALGLAYERRATGYGILPEVLGAAAAPRP